MICLFSTKSSQVSINIDCNKFKDQIGVTCLLYSCIECNIRAFLSGCLFYCSPFAHVYVFQANFTYRLYVECVDFKENICVGKKIQDTRNGCSTLFSSFFFFLSSEKPLEHQRLLNKTDKKRTQKTLRIN